jgi:autotransporter passenger strand-loop-strand repeat protein
VTGGIASGTVVLSGGTQYVTSGTAIGTTVDGGGVLELLAGAITSGTVTISPTFPTRQKK